MEVAVVTVSDSCYAGTATDKSGPHLKSLLEADQRVKSVSLQVIPDDHQQIVDTLKRLCDDQGAHIVLTTGGTGFSSRDVTPEATQEVITRSAPGLSLAMLQGSLKITHMAMLSRPVCGIRGRSLIINLPGSQNAADQCLNMILPSLGHAVDLLRDDDAKIKATHKEMTDQTDHDVHHKPIKRMKSVVDEQAVAHRPRESQYEMVSVQEALDIVLEHAKRTKLTQQLQYQEALGFTLAEDVLAQDALPPFPASIKDGYAVRSADGAGLRKVLGDVTAGNKCEVFTGHCVRISTGAVVPPGADAVVQVEDTELVKDADGGRAELEINILTAPAPGQDIRPVGVDIKSGERVLCVGESLGAAEIGLLATVGVTQVKVFSKPVVGVLSTGNELVEPGQPLKKGKIRDSNRSSLLASLSELGFPAVDLGIAKDSADALLGQIEDALSRVDIIISSGGISMGEKDLIKDVLRLDLKASIHFARVFMKPGKPTTFTTLQKNGKTKLFFGLPGNPASSIVTFNLYVAPALKKMAGVVDFQNTRVKVKLSSELTLDSRPEYHRAVLSWQDGYPVAVSTGGQMSSRLLSMKSANSLLILPPSSDERKSLSAGEEVDAILI